MNRSFHFIPADNNKFLEKSKGINADIHIYDLEDAVSNSNKKKARDNISNLAPHSESIFIRLNSVDSDWIEEDLKLIKDLSPKVGVILPKTQCLDNIEYILNKLDRKVRVIPLIEDFTALMDSVTFLKHPMIFAAGLGVEDLLSNLPYTNEHLDLLIDNLRFELIKCSRACGVLPIDLISTETKNMHQFESECLKSRSMGFTSKFSIHPNQLKTINHTFSPNKEELNWAKNILDHSSDENSGYKMHPDGILTTPPKIKKALNIIKYEQQG
ncbi:MAG: aldolase/citrate lyase family protein [Brumimicrobium sp.]